MYIDDVKGLRYLELPSGPNGLVLRIVEMSPQGIVILGGENSIFYGEVVGEEWVALLRECGAVDADLYVCMYVCMYVCV